MKIASFNILVFFTSNTVPVCVCMFRLFCQTENLQINMIYLSVYSLTISFEKPFRMISFQQSSFLRQIVIRILLQALFVSIVVSVKFDVLAVLMDGAL